MRLKRGTLPNVRHPISIIYKEASDAQKVWVEAVNAAYRNGGTRQLKKSLDQQTDAGERIVDYILDKLPILPKVVADVGSGYGGIAIGFAKKHIKVIAVEPDYSSSQVMKYFLSVNKNVQGHLTVKQGFAENLPIPSNSVDLCILSQVLEHVRDPDKTLSEVARVLKKGGYCHLTSPNYLFPFEQHYHLPYFPLMSKHLFKSWATFLLKTLNISNINNVKRRDFSKVESFIDEINYTTDKYILKLCKKYKLRVVWSACDQQKSLTEQVQQHWALNRTPINLLQIVVSLPVKVMRSLLAQLGVLPMKLEYLLVASKN